MNTTSKVIKLSCSIINNNTSLECMPNEVWKQIKGYEGIYEVSSLGRVKSLDRTRVSKADRTIFYPSTIIKPQNNRKYKRVCLRNGKPKSKSVHRLVANAFIPNIDNKKQVNHIDENPSNNQLYNLEWATQYENAIHGTAIERSAKKRSKVVYQYNSKGDFIKLWKSCNEIGRKGFSRASVNRCCNLKTRQSGGYVWSFIKLTNENVIKRYSEPKINHKARKVYQYNLEGDLIKIWDSCANTRKGGFTPSQVSSCCVGKVGVHKNNRFSYIG